MSELICQLPYWLNVLIAVTLFVLGHLLLMEGITEEVRSRT